MNHQHTSSVESTAADLGEDTDEAATTERTPDRGVEPMNMQASRRASGVPMATDRGEGAMKPVGWPELRAFPPDPTPDAKVPEREDVHRALGGASARSVPPFRVSGPP